MHSALIYCMLLRFGKKYLAAWKLSIKKQLRARMQAAAKLQSAARVNHLWPSEARPLPNAPAPVIPQTRTPHKKHEHTRR